MGLIRSRFRERYVGGFWVRLGSLVGIVGFVVVVGLINDRFLDIWGLGFTRDLVLAFAENFAF